MIQVGDKFTYHWVGHEELYKGRIIEESYQPTVSKQFIRAEVRNDNGAWKQIPLGMTES